MKMPKTYTAHRLDIYDTELYVTTTKRGWANIRRLVPFGELDATAGGQTHSGQWQPDNGAPNENAIGIYINPNHKTPGEHLNTCAHEATHAAEKILTDAATEPAGEPLAYLVGWITRWLWENTR